MNLVDETVQFVARHKNQQAVHTVLRIKYADIFTCYMKYFVLVFIFIMLFTFCFKSTNMTVFSHGNLVP